MLDAAARSAVAAGRQDVADYIRLKATNDAIRTTAVKWLIDTLIEAASDAMREHANLIVERVEQHEFRRGNSTMAGPLLELKQGVRRLSLAAGWARVPSHGIMQDQALAYARITHLGMPKAGTELRLVRGDDLPQWLDPEKNAIGLDHLSHHVAVFLS